MSIAACAALVERGDPDRFLAVMAAPLPARERLFPLYAFNLEVARAPWVTTEPMIAEMRLQWWRDVVEEAAPRAHEVAGPLHRLIGSAKLPVDVLDRLIAARRWDVWTEPFGSQAELDEYLSDTAGGLMWLAAKALGAPDSAEAAARDLGWAAGLAAFLRAVPELKGRGRRPLPDESASAIAALADEGFARLSRARQARRSLGSGRPAALAAWQAGPLLKLARREPERVAAGALALPEFQRRGWLLWAAITGRW